MASEEDYGSSDSEEGLIDDNPNKTNKLFTTNKKRKKKSSKSRPDKKAKKSSGGFIDDAAEESGSENDNDSEDEEDDDDVNDYERDGFVVDEADEEEVKKKKSGDLEDSDDDDDDDDDGNRQTKKLKKLRDVDVLDEDDLDLINEARGIPSKHKEEKDKVEEKGGGSGFVKAKDASDLQRGLFTGDSSDEEAAPKKKAVTTKSTRVEQYDEDGLDDFIEDDIGDQDEIHSSRRAGYGVDDAIMDGGVSEAQLNMASDIFGTDYLDFMDGTQKDEGFEEEDYDDFGEGGGSGRRKKYRERGVGVALGVDSDEEIEDDSESDDDEDEDDLFGDELDNVGDRQRAEVLKLKREKKRLAREERRKERRDKIDAKRKAKLRKAFEPVQLVENFCTDRDDKIRMVDSPERFYDWLESENASSKGRAKPLAIGEELTLDEREQAQWIIGKIPEIQSEFYAISANNLQTPGEEAPIMDDEEINKKEMSIVESIVNALRYMRGEKLEPDFIKRYRKDYITSPAVRANLYRIMDEDAEWERMTEARLKIDGVLSKMHENLKQALRGDADKVNDEVSNLKEELRAAQEQLDETVKDEERVKLEIAALEKSSDDMKEDKEDDDDELFGDDDEDDEAVSSFVLIFSLASWSPRILLKSFVHLHTKT